MRVLAERDGKVYGAITVEVPGDFEAPFVGALFPCLVWDHSGRFSETDRSAVARALLDAGCRYAVCGGQRCEAWEAAVDVEFVTRHADASQEALDAAHVMTTSHRGESPDDVAFFFVLNTNFDEHAFERYLVLHIGTGPAEHALEAAVRGWALDP